MTARKPNNATMDAFTIVAPEEDYTKVYKLFSSKVLEDLQTMNVEAKILLWLLAHRTQMNLQASGFTEMPQEMLAIALGVTRAAVNRALQKLKKKEYIEQLRPKSTVWRISPNLCFRGTLTNYWKHNAKPSRFGVDVYCPWSAEDYSKMKAGEQPLPGLAEVPDPKAM